MNFGGFGAVSTLHCRQFFRRTASKLQNQTRRLCSSETATTVAPAATLDDDDNSGNDGKAKLPKTFAEMMRKSKFVQMGDPVGKVVVGKVYHVVGDDLYIDFGFKLPCVCQAPRDRKKLPQARYARGSLVRVLIKDLELSQKFLGFEDQEVTLLEADCVLLGPAKQSGNG